MDYKKIYNNLINKAQNRLLEGYKEKHHIIPKCIGGTDDPANLAVLTAEEHYIAHQLLVKIYPNKGKLIYALRMMCVGNNNHSRNNKEYGWVKRKWAAEHSQRFKGIDTGGRKFQKGHTMSTGENNGMYNKNHSDYAKNKMSEIALNRNPESYNHARRPKSEEHKEKIQKTKQKRKFLLISPNKEEYIFDRAKEASEFCGVSISVLQKLASNRYKFNNCKGWQCKPLPL